MNDPQYAELSDLALASLNQQDQPNYHGTLFQVRLALATAKCYRYTAEQARYKDILYPADALQLLEFAMTHAWPAGQTADETLSEYLLDWCEKSQKLPPKTYLQQIFAACQALNCLDNAFDKLNLLAIVPLEQDRITITTKVGSTSKVQRCNHLTAAARDRAVKFLKAHKCFEPNLKTLYARIELRNKNSTLEACLVSWICSLMLKSLVSHETRPLHLSGNNLLVAPDY